ncbi:MAG: ABC transporter permease [Acidobacteria bacterium]|nr:ABC transporter permease [Acidobacteriota bacterium]
MALIHDFRIAARMLLKNPTGTLIALLALALGLGANVAIFSVVGLMIRVPLPYPDSAQLIYIPQTNARSGFNQAAASLQDVRDWQSAQGIESIGAYQSRPMAISGEGEPQHLPAMQVTPEFFPILGIRPAVGRVFSPAEGPESESRVAVLSYAFWQGTYRGEESVLGQTVRLNSRNYTIIGVMPEHFHFLYRKSDVWVPLALSPAQRVRSWRGLNTVARLRPGVSIDQAAAQVRSISARIAIEDPKSSADWSGQVRPLTDRAIPAPARASAAAMFGAVGFVLLIACANVASLQLARGMLRRREFALRASLGAGRASLIRLQAAESLLLSLAGGAVAVIASYWTVPLLKQIAPADMQIFEQARVDVSTLGFAFGLSILSGTLFGAVPAWLLTRGNLADGLRESSRGSTGGRHLLLKGLVVSEMTLALVLVAGATMMIRSLIRQQTGDPGFDKTNLTAATVLLPAVRYPEAAQSADFYSRALEHVLRDNSVESAAVVQTLPLAGDNSYIGVRVEGNSDPRLEAPTGNMIVSPGYFQTMRIPLTAGRDFTVQDRAESAPIAIVNETFAHRYWPSDSLPLGRRLRAGGDKSPWITVVGVARDVRHLGFSEPPRPEVYRPHSQAPERTMTLVARSRTPGQSSAAAIRSAIFQLDREQPLFRLQSVEAFLLARTPGARATTKVLGGLAAIALLLAAIGTYSVMAYTAAQRLREIGIRLALGATSQSVFAMVLKNGLTLAGIGLLIGLPAAYGVTPLLRMATDGLQPNEHLVYAGVALLLFLTVIVASAAPARIAMRVDPATILRSD